MSRLALAGVCLIAAAPVCLIGSLLDSGHGLGPWSDAAAVQQRYRLSTVAWALGACIAFAGAAAGYHAVAVTPRRSLPAAGLALMGVVASTWIIETTLRIAYTAVPARQVSAGEGWVTDLVGMSPDPLPIVAVVSSGVGLALLAGAAWHAGLLRPAVGGVLAAAAVLGAITAEPAVPFLIGAGPLGVALLVASRPRAPGVRAVGTSRQPEGGDSGGAAEVVERREQGKLMGGSVALGLHLALAAPTGGTQ